MVSNTKSCTPYIEGGLPWKLPKDMAYFRAVTSKAGRCKLTLA